MYYRLYDALTVYTSAYICIIIYFDPALNCKDKMGIIGIQTLPQQSCKMMEVCKLKLILPGKPLSTSRTVRVATEMHVPVMIQNRKTTTTTNKKKGRGGGFGNLCPETSGGPTIK